MEPTQLAPHQFIVLKNGQQHGPYSKEMLLESVKIGELTFDDLIWQPPMPSWEPLRYHITDDELSRAGILTDQNPSKLELLKPDEDETSLVLPNRQELAPSDNQALAITNPYLRDLNEMQIRAEKVAPIFKTGSFLGRAIYPVSLVLDKLKKVGFGLPWKAVVKIVPPIKVIDESIVRIQNSLARLAAPTHTLCKFLPSVICGIQARESGINETPGLSGQLYLVANLVPTLHNDLANLNDLIHNTAKAANAVGNSVGKLNSVKGIGSLAERLKEALLKLDGGLQEAEGKNNSLLATFARVLDWLPQYQASIRRPLPASKNCQISVKAGVFKKDLCQQAVIWFDDEAPAICDTCSRSVCEQHRVEIRAAIDVPNRCNWRCINCAK